MFNLGTKQVVINGASNVTKVQGSAGVPSIVNIEGFGTFSVPSVAAAAAREGAITVAAAAVKGVYTISITGYDDTKTYDLVLGVRSERVLSNIFSDGDVWTFQSKKGTGSAGASFAAGQIAGFNDQVIKFSGTANVVITFQTGYEGVVIETATLREVATEVSVPITIAITTQPSTGVGLGRQIEEEVQNATMDNLDPYGSKGGNETVDVRGKYTEIHWTCVAEDDDSPGWAPHAMTGYGDANTASLFAPRHFAVYANEASASAAIAILSLLVKGEDI